METYLVNFADGNQKYLDRQLIQNATAGDTGYFDEILSYDLTILDEEFKSQNAELLSYQYGAGVWVWKPYILKHVCQNIASTGDLVFYCDADHRFDKNPRSFFELLDEREGKDRDIFLFHEWGDQAWNCTYPNTFQAMGAFSEDYLRTTMLLAGYHLWRVGENAITFIEKWLEWCCRSDAILPSGDEPDIKTHCFDQSILTVLAKQEGITSAVSPKTWGIISEVFKGEK